MNHIAALSGSVIGALRPANAPWAVGSALWAMATAALIGGTGVLVGDLQVAGVAFLGAACAVGFLATGSYRARWRAVIAQASGGALGIGAGTLVPVSTAGLVLTAATAGTISGLIGGIGSSATAFGMMLSVGVAFGQFGGSSLPWWQQVLWYLAGAAVATVALLASWAFRRGAQERRAVAGVFDAAADLCAAIGAADASAARARLAAASAIARATRQHRQADLVALAAAALYAQGKPVPDPAIEAIRLAARQIRAGKQASVVLSERDDPWLLALADALRPDPVRPGAPVPATSRLSSLIRTACSRDTVANGVRIGLCLAVATGITVAMHERTHSFWLPLTTAVIVRPEYASVFVRTVNRIFGTLIGALLVTGYLAVWPSGLPVVVATALALGFVVLSAPKLYGLSVIGITSAALLSQSIGQPDPNAPAIRLVDTLIGAAVAVVFGYLLWPGARRLPGSARFSSALAAARRYFAEAVKPAGQRRRWQATRDEAYRLAHRVRAGAEAAVLEPPPVSSLAAQAIPAAIELEDAVDAITAISVAIDGGDDPVALIDDVEHRLARLDQSAVAIR
ncbi:FUSC family protein [Mycobacterium gastri]|nr:FUSC family protein [Mycobacterium gastri]